MNLHRHDKIKSNSPNIYNIFVISFLSILCSAVAVQPFINDITKPWIKLAVMGVTVVVFIFALINGLVLCFLTASRFFNTMYGHFGYILQLAKTQSLPTENSWQFYHPPLHYAVSAVIVKIGMLFCITNKYALGDLLQHYTTLFSCGISLIE